MNVLGRVLGVGVLGLCLAGSGLGQDVAKPRGPMRVSGGVMAGEILTKVQPHYPADAKAQGVSGAVVMRAVIGKDGTIENLTVLSGPEVLRDSAMEAVRQWVYRPFLLNGEATEVDTTITVNYSLGNGPGAGLAGAAPEMISGPGAAGGPVRVQGVVIAGSLVSKVPPRYPADAKTRGVQGTVLMHAIIGKDGTIQDLSVISGPEELQASAMEAVRQWVYKPYLLNGEPTEVDTRITVNFALGTPKR